MDHIGISRYFLVVCTLALMIPISAHAWSNGQAADIALGQVDLNSTAAGLNADQLFAPGSGCLDPTTQDLWVVVYGLQRAVMWSASNKLVTGSSASKILGQPDFTTANAATTATGLNSPVDCAFDAAGNLYVSDRNNNRVLRYNSAASKANGASADLVLGQADFTSGSSNRGGAAAANTLSLPYGVVIDVRGNLWVVDMGNNRILRYDNPMSKANGADADFVLGQADFTSASSNRGGGVAANTLNAPYFVAVDANETLLVSDSSNHRVLKWSLVYSKANGADADTVFGQANFTANSANRGGAAAADTLSGPVYGVAIDSYGGIYISDSGNNRILYYNNGVSMASGDTADNVLGQPDFVTTTNSAVAATTLGDFAMGTVLDEALGRLWVVSYSFYRVTSFYDNNIVDNVSPAMPTVTGIATTTNTTPTWTWSSNGGGNGTFRYKLDDTDLTTGATETMATTFTPGTGLTPGAHTLYVQERDNAGNWSVSGSFTTMIGSLYYSVQPKETSMADTGTGALTPWNLLVMFISLVLRNQSVVRRMMAILR